MPSVSRPSNAASPVIQFLTLLNFLYFIRKPITLFLIFGSTLIFAYRRPADLQLPYEPRGAPPPTAIAQSVTSLAPLLPFHFSTYSSIIAGSGKRYQHVNLQVTSASATLRSHHTGTSLFLSCGELFVSKKKNTVISQLLLTERFYSRTCKTSITTLRTLLGRDKFFL